MNQPLIITAGEPAGIGPDLVVTLAAQGKLANCVVVADPALLAQRAQQLGLSLNMLEADHADTPHDLHVWPCELSEPCQTGVLDKANSEYVLKTLRMATEGCLSGRFHGLVTAPVHKGIINDAGIAFSGHTEFLAEITGGHPVMMLAAGDELRVALITTHLPLAKVPAAITRELIHEVVSITDRDLRQRFGIPNPRIKICGLNPHAGENGHMGREEIDVITPAISQLAEEGLQVSGPYPADTVFTPRHIENSDVIVAMYHDQGLPVLKHVGFGRAVNITLGLPIIRTSVDHGTALELAGTGNIETGSLLAAIDCARMMQR